jgi:2-iminoacetate synthase ThiH
MYSERFSFDETVAKRQRIPSSLPSKTIDQLLLSLYDVFTDLTDAQLEALAQRAACITKQRFGNVMRFFVPLYLSNEC